MYQFNSPTPSALRPLSFRFVPHPFLLKWIGGTLIGFLVSLLLVEVGERPELGVIEGTIGGGTIGLVQALVLSQFLAQAWLWILANLISWGLMAGGGFGAIGWFAPTTAILSSRLAYGIIFGAMSGIWLGAWQWLVLRKQVPDAWRWVVAMLASWSIGLSIGWTLAGILRTLTHLYLSEVIGLIVTWSIVATITGMVLVAFEQETVKRNKRERGQQSL